MTFLTRLIVILVLVAMVGGVVFLATWNMDPPLAQVEKQIPAERFQK